ncbi:MAG: ABC transporter permease [Rhodothermales bacterium]
MSHFDLDTAIATWRRFVQSARVLEPDDIDELEAHIRDLVEERMATGHTAEAAFHEAVQQVGSYHRLEQDFNAVRWQKLWSEHRITDELRGYGAMLGNYLKVALRSMRKQKLYTAINGFGLAVGIAVCLLLLLFVRHEWSYDQFHTHKDRLHRLTVTYKGAEQTYASKSAFAAPVGPALAAEYPEVEQVVRIGYTNGSIVRRNERLLAQASAAVDPAFLSVFSFELLQGDASTALQDPSSVVLTASTAERFFGEADPMGQDLLIQVGHAFEAFTVTGVLADVPETSSIQFSLLLPFSRMSDLKGEPVLDNWDDSFASTFVLVRPDAQSAAIDAKLPGFVTKYYGHWFEGFRNRGIDGADGDLIRYSLQPLSEIRHDESVEANEPVRSPLFTYLLMGIAIFILFIACINFVNLAIARTAARTKEIGVRKAMGAVRQQVMLQFWGEAFLMSIGAAIVGVGLALLSLPVFNELAEKNLGADLLLSGTTLWMVVGLVLGVGLLAGSYPALVLSGFRPVEVLRGRLRPKRRAYLGQGLMVFQFALSAVLIIVATIVYQQVEYLRGQDVGFDTEQMVVVPTFSANTDTPYLRYRDALADESSIIAVTGSSLPLSFFRSRQSTVIGDQRFQSAVARVDYTFIDVMDIGLVAGRNVSVEFATDAESAVLVNERFVRHVGWTPEEAIGQSFPFYDNVPVTIVGVIEDFHITSLHTPIEPTILHVNPTRSIGFVLAKIAPTGIPATIDLLEQQWRTLYPDLPFSYSFMDQRVEQQYAFEARVSAIMGYAMFLATLVACLGLFGMAALSVARRTKEIGIRKVLGASAVGVTQMLSRQFVVLVVAANVIAWPLAYWSAQQMMQAHAYRVAIDWTPFALTIAVSVVLACVAVAYQAIRAAVQNPVDALRYE